MLINRGTVFTSLFKEQNFIVLMVYLFIRLNDDNSYITLLLNPFKLITPSSFTDIIC